MNEANRLGEIADQARAKAAELDKRFDAVEHQATIKQLEADKIKAEKSSDEWLKLYQDIKGSLRYLKHNYDSLKAETGERIAILKAELIAANEALLIATGSNDMLIIEMARRYNGDLAMDEVEMSTEEMAVYAADKITILITPEA